MDNRSEIWRRIDEVKPRFVELSDRVWGMPEINYTEVRSMAEHAAELRHQGFKVTEGVAGIPTAVMGEAGEGGPVIAVLGEYDALPELSQEAGATEHKPVEKGGPGHGCGHNLLGSASMLAATAIKDWLAANKLKGRVRYYGCPAEEGGSAKTFMARAGVFKDVDAAICWHPGWFWQVLPADALAMTLIDFTFTGRAAHAAASPHLGRSALDAVELMNIGVNYMREHMPSDARIHYATVDAGGIAPNVVQAHARVRYSVRARDLDGMFELLSRVKKIADGAALMSETSVKSRVLAGMSNLLPNTPMEEALQTILEDLGPPAFDDADLAFAKAMQKTFPDGDIDAAFRSAGVKRKDKPLCDFTVPLNQPHEKMMGSTDVGDVSWVTPTVQALAPNFAIGTPFHAWQMVSQGKSPAAHKGMVQVAKAMAALGQKLIEDKALLASVRADFEGRIKASPYRCPIPQDIAPPVGGMG
ncbi:MAG: M20 family metallopeptidase [Proteobacteria bacterium]|nr:M20 family metallopeptidase [Pseudomonadota bacterium]